MKIKNAFAFPFQSPQSRREILIGGTWLFIPIYGWILNLGHRVVYTHNWLNGKAIFPAWNNRAEMFHHGIVTVLGMVYYHLPGAIGFVASWALESGPLFYISSALWLAGTLIVPGYMTAYCKSYDRSTIFDLKGCIKCIKTMGWRYLHAWGIVILGLFSSLSGLIVIGVGFFYTSVAFWQIAAYAFCTAGIESGVVSLVPSGENEIDLAVSGRLKKTE